VEVELLWQSEQLKAHEGMFETQERLDALTYQVSELEAELRVARAEVTGKEIEIDSLQLVLAQWV
jgi:hypothetical protein